MLTEPARWPCLFLLLPVPSDEALPGRRAGSFSHRTPAATGRPPGPAPHRAADQSWAPLPARHNSAVGSASRRRAPGAVLPWGLQTAGREERGGLSLEEAASPRETRTGTQGAGEWFRGCGRAKPSLSELPARPSCWFLKIWAPPPVSHLCHQIPSTCVLASQVLDSSPTPELFLPQQPFLSSSSK